MVVRQEQRQSLQTGVSVVVTHWNHNHNVIMILYLPAKRLNR